MSFLRSEVIGHKIKKKLALEHRIFPFMLHKLHGKSNFSNIVLENDIHQQIPLVKILFLRINEFSILPFSMTDQNSR